jgi:abequosyltransferase
MGCKITVCIPAYNRASLLAPLLDSIVSQDFRDYEILVCEDKSPEREKIGRVIGEYRARHPGLIRYYENEKNLGYDGQIRNLVEKAQGEYCFFMGNDDLMAPSALSTVAAAVSRHPDIGVVLRSYASFTASPSSPAQVFRYFEKELFFPAGRSTMITFFRRTVVISGLVLHRGEALRHSTGRFDGTLLYQIYLAARILARRNGLSLPDILAYYREGGIPDFGNSESEKGKFTPKQQTPESSVHFMRGMLEIARYVDREEKIPVYEPIVRDIANYSYPVLSIQASQSLPVFCRYALKLVRLGFWRSGLFFAYFLAILVLGPARIGRLIQWLKSRLGHTPRIGNLAKGSQA